MKKLKEHAVGKTITHVETNEDTIVFSGGITHVEFVNPKSSDNYTVILIVAW